jgi:hypothetical protein
MLWFSIFEQIGFFLQRTSNPRRFSNYEQVGFHSKNPIHFWGANLIANVDLKKKSLN